MRKTTPYQIDLRLFLLSVTLLLLTSLAACTNVEGNNNTSPDKDFKSQQKINKDPEFDQLEDKFDAIIGVYAIDTGNNQTVEYQPNERFVYSSTFKVLATAIMLKHTDMKDLEKIVTYNKSDLVAHSPVTEKHVETGMTLLEISDAAIRKSDNTAGNLLLEAIGGPEKFGQALRELGDDVTQPKRYETELNEFTPGNKQDTSTPKAMATSLKITILDDFLSDEKRELLMDWMKGNEAGDTLIRAGAPTDWVVNGKSGAGTYGTRNDIAIVTPPDREPIVIAVMSRHDEEHAEFDDALIAEAAEITLNALK